MNLDLTQKHLGLTFSDKTLLQRALTHRSYLNENPDYPLENNERLEFLGDAVIDFITGEYLYHRFPEMHEGELTSLRSALVKTESLASFAARINLGEYLLLGKGEENSGGRTRLLLLCSAFEALTGALYLDQGLASATAFIIAMIKPEVQTILQTQSHRDPKSIFQELAQNWYKTTPTYKTIREEGPDHAKTFIVGAYLGDVCYGEGSGNSKQHAAQAAAQAAVLTLKNELTAKGLNG